MNEEELRTHDTDGHDHYMTKEQQIAHWSAVVDIVLTAEKNIPDEEKQALVAARGAGESMERRAIERYIRAVATKIVEAT